jgi:hypothetical protein
VLAAVKLLLLLLLLVLSSCAASSPRRRAAQFPTLTREGALSEHCLHKSTLRCQREIYSHIQVGLQEGIKCAPQAHRCLHYWAGGREDLCCCAVPDASKKDA